LFGFVFLRRFNHEVNTAETKALLKQYGRTGSEPAFRELVNRYVGLVYSTAKRLLGSESHLAEDVTQRVFIQLARKASGLPESVSLAGWLHRSTCHMVATTLRGEWRRHARERQAMELHDITNHPDPALAAIAPLLDDAIESLDAEDRAAILLRFFEKNSFRAVGQALRVTEDAARMRVNRALGKLEALLKTRGVTISVTTLGAALTTGSLTAAPSGLAGTVTTSALASAGMPTTLLALMTQGNLKTLLVAALFLCLVAGVGVSLMKPSLPPRAELPVALPPVPENTTAEAAPSAFAAIPAPGDRGQSPEIEMAIQNLWRALREEPVDENNYATSAKVENALRAFGPDRTPALPTLLEGLQDTNATVQMCSQWGFNFLGRQAESAIPELVKLSLSQAQPLSTRDFALQALGGMATIYGSPRDSSPDAVMLTVAIPALTSLLQDQNLGLRAEAARVLGNMGYFATEAIPGLIELLGFSATAENVQTPNAEPIMDEARLKALMDRSTASVRESAAAALTRMGAEAQDAVPHLSVLLDDKNRRVRATAAVALWRIGGRTDVAPVLAETLYPPRCGDQGWHDCVAALGEMGPAAASCSPTLQKLCRWGNPEIHLPALEVLAKIDPAAAVSLRSNMESK
jgi:RNA polymerase sigma factor (sigma-70 family)